MALVKEFKIGNTQIRIFDDYCLKTEAEVEQLLREIADTALRHINSAFVTDESEKEENGLSTQNRTEII